MLRVFIRHVDYDSLHLEEGVRLFVAEKEVDTPASAGGAAAADSAAAASGAAAADSAAAAGGGKGGKRTEIQGFVLVDPLWRDGEVYGYVTSLNRMRRDGHHGGCGSVCGWNLCGWG